MKSLYIIENQNNDVKIGVSKDPHKRIRQLENQSGYKIINKTITEPFDRFLSVESFLHKEYSIYRKQGEWFSINYSEAILKLRFLDIETWDQA